MRQLASEVARCFGRAAQLAFFRHVPRYTADPPVWPVICLAIIAIVTGAALEAAAAGDELSLSGKGVAITAAAWCIYACALWACRPRSARFGLALILADSMALMSLAYLLMAAAWLATEHAGLTEGWTQFGVIVAILVWLAASLWRAGRLVWTGSEWLYGVKPALCAAAISLLMPSAPMITGTRTEPGFDVWQIASAYWSYYQMANSGEDQFDDYKRVDVERTYYKQPELVREALNDIAPSDPAKAEYYFVAAAAYAEQNVFKSEVEKARALFDERFGTKGRSLVAINHADEVERTPLANATNLEAILTGLGQKMDRENDVLVLFLTSHGAPKRFSVSFSGFSFNDLTPVRLREILDQSGIKNRVLIISACYSGSFVPDLKDENTLVMTAASDSRTSFGCSNEREWTYFGDALFNHALRETFSFEAAFYKARETVSGWEQEQKIEPSDPQVATGMAIHARLKSISSELAVAAAGRHDAQSGHEPAALEPAAMPAVELDAADSRADAREAVAQ